MTRLPKRTLDHLLELDCTLQQIPSPTFCEEKKAAFVLDTFTKEGLQDAHLDQAGNAMARIPGNGGNPLVITAHMDTVFPPSIPLTLQRQPDRILGPSIGDNSLGVAALLALPRILSEENIHLPGDIWLVANTCEEGLGDLRGMRAVVDAFGSLPTAYLLLEGMGLRQIYHRGLGVERYRITVRTAGGHSWVDYGKPSAIHHLALLITRITSRPIPKEPRTSLNVGIIQGGTSVNTIAAQASFELDLRSEDGNTLRLLSHQIKSLVEDAETPGVKMEIEQVGLRPAGEIPQSHPLVRLAEKCLREEGIQPNPEIASTDANIPLSRGLPAVCIGLTTGGNAHTTAEYIDIDPVHSGIGAVLRLIKSVWNLG